MVITQSHPAHSGEILWFAGGLVETSPGFNDWFLATPPALAADHIRLKGPVAFDSTYAGSVREFRLAAGDYYPIGEDREGAYYKEPPRCFRGVWTKTRWVIKDSMLNQGTFADCGIFVPKNAALPAKGFLSPSTQTAYLPPDQMAVENARQAASLNQASSTAELPSASGAGEKAVQDLSATLPGQMASTPLPGASPMQAGVGGVIGMGIVQAMIAAGDGDIAFLPAQPTGNVLRDAIELIDAPVPVPAALAK